MKKKSKKKPKVVGFDFGNELEKTNGGKRSKGLLAQMEESSIVYKAETLTNERMIQLMEDFLKTSPTWNSTYSNYIWPSNEVFDKKTEETKEVVEKGVKTQVIFGDEGYEIVDGKIVKVLSIDAINKLKNYEKSRNK